MSNSFLIFTVIYHFINDLFMAAKDLDSFMVAKYFDKSERVTP